MEENIQDEKCPNCEQLENEVENLKELIDDARKTFDEISSMADKMLRDL